MRVAGFLGIFGLAAGGAATAADPNLLPNGDFSDANQAVYWTHIGVPDSGMAWSSEDAFGASGSGSLELSTHAGGGGTYALATCFDVQPNAAYSVGGQARRSAGSTFPVRLRCAGYGAYGCASSPSSFGILLDISGNNGSNWGESVVSSGTLPNDTFSVSCEIDWGDYASGGQQLTLLVDNLFFSSAAPPTPVRLQDFFVE